MNSSVILIVCFGVFLAGAIPRKCIFVILKHFSHSMMKLKNNKISMRFLQDSNAIQGMFITTLAIDYSNLFGLLRIILFINELC